MSHRKDSPAHRPLWRRLLGMLACASLLACVGLPAQAAAPASNAPRVELDTSLGPIVLQLDAVRAPRTVANFLRYVREGFYAGTIFHRVIPGFVIQGGGYTRSLQHKPTAAPIPLESRNGLRNLRGTIAMARTGDPDSATSQFFINLANNSSLDYPQPDGYGYAVFGHVVTGMKVVDRIAALPTHEVQGMSDVPVQPVLIRSARVLP